MNKGHIHNTFLLMPRSPTHVYGYDLRLEESQVRLKGARVFFFS